nr:eukaryotic initiation factor 4A-15-like [Tanacetum cinerariifolium]
FEKPSAIQQRGIVPFIKGLDQIEKVMRALGDYLGVRVHACVGGNLVREDQSILAACVHVVVGTTGRVFDLLKRRSLRADYIKMLVLDEAVITC